MYARAERVSAARRRGRTPIGAYRPGTSENHKVRGDHRRGGLREAAWGSGKKRTQGTVKGGHLSAARAVHLHLKWLPRIPSRNRVMRDFYCFPFRFLLPSLRPFFLPSGGSNGVPISPADNVGFFGFHWDPRRISWRCSRIAGGFRLLSVANVPRIR